MIGTNQFLINHGLPILFGVILLEQLGLPIPGVPWLLAAGALAATGHFNAIAGLVLATVACLIADFAWFYLGKFRGAQILGLLCRFSLEPDTCVRSTVNVFHRYGWRGILIAKFIPGMSTVTPPLAGLSGLSSRRFLLFDGLGSLLYCGVFLLLGALFSNQIAQIVAIFEHFGWGALRVILVLPLALYIAFKFWHRQSLLRELRMAKITVSELRQLLDADAKPCILDLRSAMELKKNPVVILGALHLSIWTNLRNASTNSPATGKSLPTATAPMKLPAPNPLCGCANAVLPASALSWAVLPPGVRPTTRSVPGPKFDRRNKFKIFCMSSDLTNLPVSLPVPQDDGVVIIFRAGHCPRLNSPAQPGEWSIWRN